MALEFTVGQPCWMDLTVKDVKTRDSLMEFLGALFGWTFEVGGAEAGFYTIASSNGEHVAALMADPDGFGQFLTYLYVDDIEATTARAVENGATVLMGPMQVMDSGTMAIGIDPSGAAFGLWQPADFTGFDAFGRPNAPCWFDHQSASPASAAEFYARVFDLEVQPTGDDGSGILGRNGVMYASASDLPSGVPPRWAPIVAVSSIADSEEKAVELGAMVLVSNLEVPGGFASAFATPITGTIITVFESPEMPAA